MYQVIFRFVPVVAVSLMVSGCHNTDTVTAPPENPSTVESFSGTLSLNGATSYPFTVAATGGVTAQLTALAAATPEDTKPVGLALGTWNGSICQVVLFNDVSHQGALVVGVASTTGDFCVRVYDAAGVVVQPQTYTVDVEHN